MSKYFKVYAVSTPGDLLEEVGRRENATTHGIKMHRGITPLRDIISIVKMVRFLRKTRPTIVHTHTPKAGLVGLIAASLTGVPIRLYSIAGITFETVSGPKRRLLILIEKLTYKLAHKVYANSFGHLDLIKRMNLCPPEKVSVLGSGSTNGINLDFFCPSKKLYSEADGLRKKYNLKDKFVFIYVSRLVKHKGAEQMLLSWDSFSQQNPEAQLLICGRLQSDADPLSLKSQYILNNNNQVIFVGYQKDIRSHYLCADVCVLPSLREGLPNVLLQAGAMGLPIICSNILGNTDVVREGVNGLLTKKGNVEDNVRAMTTIMHDSTLRNSLKNNARKQIFEKYERFQLLETYINEYKNLFAEKNIAFEK